MGQSVSRGTAFLMGSQFVFTLVNYLLHIFLAKYLGPSLYGVFGVLMSMYLINRNFLNIGIPRAVSKFISESKENIASIFRTAFKLEMVVAIAFGLIFLFFAPLIAGILHDLSLVKYIRFLAVMVIPLSLISLYLHGCLNGLKEFKKQALVKTIYPVLRLIFTLLLVYQGFQIWGVLFGYFIALVIVLIIAIIVCKPLIKKDKNISKLFPWKKLLYFAIPLTIASFGLTLIRNVNTLFIKSLLMDNTLVGIYTSAVTLSNVSFVIFAALPLTLLPSVSKSHAAGDIHLTRKYISHSLRYLLLLLLPIAAIIAATSKELIVLFYSANYIQAAPVLSILIFGSTFLSVFITLSSVIVGIGKPKVQMKLVLLLVVILSILNIIIIPKYGLIGSALAFSAAALLAAILSGSYVYHKFKILISMKSLLRILTASALVLVLAQYWHYSGFYLIITYIALYLLYLLVLLLLGEINQADISLYRKIFKIK